MGRLKYSGESSSNANHFWVMTIDPRFKDIDFWEPMNNRHYKLCSRIEHNDIMRKYMKGEYECTSKVDEDLKKKNAKPTNANKANEGDNKKKATKSRLAKQLTENDEIDQALIIEKPQNLLSDIDYMEQHTNLKLGTKYENLTGNNKVDEEFLIHNNLIRKRDGINNYNTAIGDIENDEKKQKNMAHDFEWKKEYEGKKLKNDVLPYKTIDVVFNKKNIWINLQNPDPVRIFYDLYNDTKWLSVLKKKDAVDPKTKRMNYIIWKQDIPTFYSFRNFSAPYTEEEIDQMRKTIQKTVMEAIRATRLIKNFPTKFKRTNKEFSDLLDLYLVYLELKALGDETKELHQRRIEQWKAFLTEIIPNKVRFTMLPLFFNYTYDNTISTYISDNCQDFLYHVKKNATFTITTKVFQYPNRICSVRVLITIMYKITKEEMEDKEYDKEHFYLQTEKLDQKEVDRYFERLELERKLKEQAEKKK